MLRALGLALTSVVWLTPPAVLPTPSRTGPEGPPRPYGAAPALGAAPARATPALAAAQTRALRDGPFPRGGLARGVSDGVLLLGSGQRARETALARIRAAGASIVRIPVDWSDDVSASPPAGFDARDPADPAYSFARLDAVVRGAAANGLTPLLVVSHAPAFAEAPARWRYAFPGSWAPSPSALGDFAAALARRYGGGFPDPARAGAALPAVHLFQAWNEPNLARYLEPQWVAGAGRWRAFSPLLYRGLLNGFYAGIKAVQPAATVVAAGVAPNGEPAGVGRMAPMTFLEQMLCVNASGARVRAGCAQPPHFDVLAIHPLSFTSADLPAASALDVSIADVAKVTRLLERARSLHTALPAGSKPLWVTELNWESAPQAPHGVPPRLQALWVSRALHRLWVAGVALVDWQFLVDPFPRLLASTPTGGTIEYRRPAGLYSAGRNGDPETAQPKQFLRGFTFPFDPLRVDRRRVRVWALLERPGQRVLVQESRHGRWRTLARLTANRAGVLNALVGVRGAVAVRAVGGGLVSAVTDVPVRTGGR